jgi:FtsP/CotA-like multicopper oxidase with cupredoxin domain
LYWYHPHIREDYAQEMGLYGQILVEPADPDYWPAVNRDIMLTLDDLLLEDGRIPVFHPSGPTHTMMGREMSSSSTARPLPPSRSRWAKSYGST